MSAGAPHGPSVWRQVPAWRMVSEFWQCAQSPHRLVVRTSRCGRDNPGATPGGDILWHSHARGGPQAQAFCVLGLVRANLAGVPVARSLGDDPSGTGGATGLGESDPACHHATSRMRGMHQRRSLQAGASYGIQTHDLPLTKRVLCQLS